MTDDDVDVLMAATRALGQLLDRHEVVSVWAQPSVLPGYTVGGIAGHVVSLLQGLQRTLAQKTVRELLIVPFTEWYARPSSAAPGDDLARRMIDVAEAIADEGPTEVADSLRVIAGQLEPVLRSARAEVGVPLLSLPGCAVSLRDYVRTRIAEVAIHANDIALSADVEVDLPEQVWCITRDVLLDSLAAQIPPSDIVRKLARPQFARDVDLSVFSNRSTG